ncbi:MAG: carboxypeptidase-like regulatory domain-containing protein [Patescibacteria group bacterium]|nr:carboxypeptidase-like regulatory domain-containing protein [Patescibacteria group bacterium]
MRTAHKFILIIIALAILLALCVFLFYKLNWKEKLSDIYFNLTNKSQTVGAVTANRDAEKIKITEITDTFWDTETISPVIGQPYKIERLKDDGRPVHVEFSYDSKTLPAKISPADLRLFKWHDENGKKYWSIVQSQVDTDRQVVSADLNTFSVLAIKAPVWLLLTDAEKDEISKKLEEMQKDPPPFTCGVFMMMDEELITDEIQYYRTGDENIAEMHDCRENESVKIANATFYFNKQGEKTGTYAANATVEWQIDPKESIILDGWVVDQNGEAVEKAQVIAQKTKYGSWEQKTTTDKNGYYKLKIHSGDYTIRVIGKDAKCPIVSTDNQYCYKGDIWEEPTTKSHWQKNFTLKKCGKYELTITSKVSNSLHSSEVHGSVLLNGASDSETSPGLITIDKMETKLGKGGVCKQIKPIQYSFKTINSNFTDQKNLSLSLDFSENEDEAVPEEAFGMSTILIPDSSPEAEADIQASLAKARQYNNYECNYISDYADFPGIEITQDSWLSDFLAMHMDEGTNGTNETLSAIIEIKDWEIVGQGGVWARKTYQREKQIFNSAYTEDTVIELKVLDK